MRKYITTVSYTDTIDYNIIVLGPRTVGKTSLVTSLTEIWKDIRALAPTPSFQRYEYIFPNARKSNKTRQVFDLALDVFEKARLVIWDYGGEDHLLDSALERFKELQGACILLLVLTSEIDRMRINNEYYSASFLKRVRDAINVAPRPTLNVFVVFAKADLLEKVDMAEVRNRNLNGIDNIMSLFGASIQFYLVSSENGNGLRPLVQNLALCAVDAQGLPK